MVKEYTSGNFWNRQKILCFGKVVIYSETKWLGVLMCQSFRIDSNYNRIPVGKQFFGEVPIHKGFFRYIGAM